jgi:hypothetical protein
MSSEGRISVVAEAKAGCRTRRRALCRSSRVRISRYFVPFSNVACWHQTAGVSTGPGASLEPSHAHRSAGPSLTSPVGPIVIPAESAVRVSSHADQRRRLCTLQVMRRLLSVHWSSALEAPLSRCHRRPPGTWRDTPRTIRRADSVTGARHGPVHPRAGLHERQLHSLNRGCSPSHAGALPLGVFRPRIRGMVVDLPAPFGSRTR